MCATNMTRGTESDATRCRALLQKFSLFFVNLIKRSSYHRCKSTLRELANAKRSLNCVTKYVFRLYNDLLLTDAMESPYMRDDGAAMR